MFAVARKAIDHCRLWERWLSRLGRILPSISAPNPIVIIDREVFVEEHLRTQKDRRFLQTLTRKGLCPVVISVEPAQDFVASTVGLAANVGDAVVLGASPDPSDVVLCAKSLCSLGETTRSSKYRDLAKTTCLGLVMVLLTLAVTDIYKATCSALHDYSRRQRLGRLSRPPPPSSRIAPSGLVYI